MKTLIQNGRLLLTDPDRFRVIEGDLVIEKDVIIGIYPGGIHAVPSAFDKVIDASGKLVMPGLINAHTHAYMSLFRNYADDLEFFDWLHKVEEVEDHLTEEDLYWATMLSVIEMLRTGTTCFVDMHLRSAKNGKKNDPEGAAGAAVNVSGIRAFLSRGMVGEAEDQDSLRRFREFFGEADLYEGDQRVKYMLGPHATYSCRPDLLSRIRDLGMEKNMMATIHIAESEAESQTIAEENGGITPVQYVAQSGLFDLPVIAAHCVNVTPEDIKLLKEKNVSIAINPRSNMKLGNGFAPVPQMLEAGLNLCLGTDGSGSNNTQNMFQEMNFAALIYKGKEKKAKCVDAADVLRFATTGGAKALQMENKLGIIKVGALADLILLDLGVPQFIPHNNIVSGLVYSANGSEVRTVLVNGRVVMEDGRILTLDEQEVYAQCSAIAQRLGMEQ